MSQMNRYDKSPNPKVARYLHRIQQIVGNRGRTPSPLSSRISKPIKPHSLDSLLKYQLTFKILIRFFDNNNKDFMRHFFNSLRSVESHKVEKIYRFVSIQKSECTHLQVDSSISTKMMFNFLRKYLNSNLKAGFQSIKQANNLAQSYLVFNTTRSIITKREKDNQKAAFFIYHHLHSLITKRQTFFIAKISLLKNKNHHKHPQTINSPFSVLFINLQNFVKRSLFISKIRAFQSLRHFSQYEKTYEAQALPMLQKIKFLGVSMWEKRKRYLIQVLNRISMDKIVNSNKKIKEQIILIKESTSNMLVSTSGFQNFDNNLFQATIKINCVLLSIIFRRRTEFLNNICRISNNKYNFYQKLFKSLCKVGNNAKMRSFFIIRKYSFAKQIIQNLEYAKQIQFGVLSLEDIFVQLLRKRCRISFNSIEKKAQFQAKKNKLIPKMTLIFSKLSFRHGFIPIKQAGKDQTLNLTPPMNQSAFFKPQMQTLPKMLNKLYLKSITNFFIKFKNQSRKKKDVNVQNINNGSWKADMQIFLKQRQNFRQGLEQKVRKVDSIIQKQQIIPSTCDRSPIVLTSPQRKGDKTFQFA